MKVKNIILLFLFVFPFLLFADIKWISPSVLKYGKIHEGEKISDSIQFVNTGNKSVEIEYVRPSCGCTVANLTKNVIAPQDTANIPFALNTMGFNGMIHKSIHISFKGNEEENTHITIQADIVRDLDVSPRYVYITRLKVDPDTTIVRTLNFCNNSETAIEISKLFTDSDLIELPVKGFTIDPNQSKDIDVKIFPKRAIHGRQFISIDTNMTSKPHMNISVYLVIKE